MHFSSGSANLLPAVSKRNSVLKGTEGTRQKKALTLTYQVNDDTILLSFRFDNFTKIKNIREGKC